MLTFLGPQNSALNKLLFFISYLVSALSSIVTEHWLWLESQTNTSAVVKIPHNISIRRNVTASWPVSVSQPGQQMHWFMGLCDHQLTLHGQCLVLALRDLVSITVIRLPGARLALKRPPTAFVIQNDSPASCN